MQNTAMHMAIAFVAMGSWAAFANSNYPMPVPLVAGLVQGALSAVITYALKRALDALRGRTPRSSGWLLPPLVALFGSLCLLIGMHWLAGTPEIFPTISVPFSVASFYAIFYNFTMWKSEAP